MLSTRKFLVLAALVYVVVLRLVPYVLERFGFSIDPQVTVYPWNFSPLMAFAIFGGAVIAHRRLSFALPLVAMLLTDLGILAFKGPEFAFYDSQFSVYACVLVGCLLGSRIRDRRNVWNLAGTGLLAETQFFLLTNLATWYFWAGTEMATYTRDAAGLLVCYTMGIPFFIKSLMSTLLYSGALFGALAWLEGRETTADRHATVVTQHSH